MKLIANLDFNGQCREAFERYAEVLGGEIIAMHTHSSTPDSGVAADWGDKIVHAWLQVGDQAMKGCDAPPESAKPLGWSSILFQAEDAAEARRVFGALADGGRVSMAIGETPWSQCFGMLTDRFGAPWMIDTAQAQRAAD